MSLLVAGALHHDVVVRAARLPRIDETLPGADVAYHLGGKAGNQAIAAARAGARVALAGSVGSDAAGAAMRAELAAARVDVSRLRTVPGASGMSVAILQADGTYGAVIVSAANLTFDGAGLSLPEGCTHLLLQNEVPSPANLTLARTAQAAGVQVIWNAAPARADPELAALTDILIVNRVEAADMLGAMPDDPAAALVALAGQGFPTVILTLGGEGVAWWDGAVCSAPAQKVTVRSTHGAGDAFCGALAAALDRGEDLETAIAAGQGAAARKVAGEPEQDPSRPRRF